MNSSKSAVERLAVWLPLAVVLILAGATLFSGMPATAAAGPSVDDEAAIRQAARTWSDVADAKDLERTVSYYAEDASMYPNGAPVVMGKQAIRQLWAQFMAQPGYSLRTRTLKVEVAGSHDLAYEVGSFELKMNDAQGMQVDSAGKYIVVWKRQADGQWKAVGDIFNMDK
jgi:uncharacterized protein (TIGR02246 family)